MTPPSPPMQMSPFKSHLDSNEEISGTGSPYLHISVSALSKSNSPSPLSSSLNELGNVQLDNTKTAYFQSYSSLLTNQAASDEGNLQTDHSPLLQKNTVLSLNRKPIDTSELQSDTASVSSAKHSVTSHELAISLLDEAIATSASPEKNTPRKTSSISSRKSASSDSSARERLARTVAQAIIAKLVKA